VCESLALGEKRFVAVIEFETERFLVGGGASSVNLLARLGEALDFAALSTESCERQR
jgi:flagellar biogenesis protein FliO